MLVQILGMKETQDLEEGFGALMQNLLSGGLEKAHAEKEGRGGTGVGGQMENDGNEEGSWMDGGGKDGRDGKGGQWREHLKGREWERYVDGMAWILQHGGGEGRGFRLGAIPKPLDQGEFPLEWEEWPRGEEAAAKLPDNASARFFHLGIVEEAKGTAGERGAGKKGGQESHAGGKIGTTRGKGDKRRRKQEERSRGRGEEERVGGVECDLDERLLQQLLTRLQPLVQRKFPIVRCTADAEFLLEFAGHMVKPPACAECKQCLAVYTHNIPFLALIANYAYRPATILFNRFVSIFPPLSPEFGQLAARIGVPPFPASVPGFLRSALVQTQAELDPVLFLLAVAHKWASPILGTTDRTYLHRPRDGKEDDGRVWEEVQMWCRAVELAWQGGMELGAAALRWKCKGKREWGGWFGVEKEEITSDKWLDLWKRAAIPRFCEDIEREKRFSEITSGSSNRSDCSGRRSYRRGNGWTRGADGKGKQGEEPAHLKPWPGGFNLLACLREMLLGEPCYRPASPVDPSSTRAAGSTETLLNSTVAGKSAPEGPVRQRKTGAEDCNSARLGGAVCGALGCEMSKG
ncbi:unnamed protein product [Closterium sp. NIES-65]|nr:unnamed protein product [Closterium sp. NIES-65]